MANKGGGIVTGDSSPTMINCIFSGNMAKYGGAMYNEHDVNSIINNCTFTNNSALDEGGAMYNMTQSKPVVTNCILWGNNATQGEEIYNISGSCPIISYSDIAGSTVWDPNLGTNGGGNIDADPCFVDANGPDELIGTEDDNLRLSTASPCIDAGDPCYFDPNNPTDLDRNPRVIDGDGNGTAIVDMGAYELSYAAPIIADGKCLPKIINTWAKGPKNIQGILFLPVGYAIEDLMDQPLLLCPAGSDFCVEAVSQKFHMDEYGVVFCRGLFNKEQVMDLITTTGLTEVNIIGQLKAGQDITATDYINIK
jgi:hypothetical protein